jgi:hypothetical protein
MAEAVLRVSERGRVGDQRVIIRTYYVHSAALGALTSNPITTYAFVSGCAASPGELEAFERTCGQILASFRPRPSWMGERVREAVAENQRLGQIIIGLIQTLVQNQQQASDMINRTASRIGQMQMQSDMSMLASKARIDDGYMQMLGTQTILQGPDGPITTQEHYNHYCKSSLDGNIYAANGAGDLNSVAGCQALPVVQP